MRLNKLTKKEEDVILHKGTELPFTGEFWNFYKPGIYVCKRCDQPLFKSESKFDGRCGWPSFDQELKDAVKRIPDEDGTRTEIQCSRCGAHLGHVFSGEEFTKKNTRHCVNSISIKFVSSEDVADTAKLRLETIVLGGGCFWCTQAVFSTVPGVVSAMPGYAGGSTKNPTYESVCTGKTGHAEVVKLEFDPKTITPKRVLEIFFSIHDPTSLNRQGNDVGTPYRSIILYASPGQKKIIEKYIANLQKSLNTQIVTEIKPLDAFPFYPAEQKHVDYYNKNPAQPYCMLVVKPKLDKIKKMFLITDG